MVFPYLQDKKLPYQDLVDAGRLPETPRSEAMDFITYSTASMLSSPTGVMGSNPFGYYVYGEFALQSGNYMLGKSLL